MVFFLPCVCVTFFLTICLHLDVRLFERLPFSCMSVPSLGSSLLRSFLKHGYNYHHILLLI